MRRILAFTLLALIATATTAKAAISYQYVTSVVGSSGGTFTATQAGQSITVNIYLQETLTAGSSSLITANGGLGGFGLQLKTTSGSGTTINSAPTFNSAFNGPAPEYNPSGSATTQSYLAAASPSAGVQLGSGTGAGANEILLVSTTLTAGAAGTTTVFQLQNGGFYGAGETTTQNGDFDLDSTNNQSGNGLITGGATYTGAATPIGGYYTFTVTVAAVPEPSSVILTGLAFAGLAFVGYRRRTKNVKCEVASMA